MRRPTAEPFFNLALAEDWQAIKMGYLPCSGLRDARVGVSHTRAEFVESSFTPGIWIPKRALQRV